MAGVSTPCVGCGKVLRDEDFARSRAFTFPDGAFCRLCRPIPPEPGGGTFARTARDSRTALLAGGVITIAGFVALIIFLSVGQGPRPPAPPPAPSRSEETLLALERAAASLEPETVLLRCDEARPAVRGTVYEARLKAVEDLARERIAVRDRDRKLDGFLEEVRRIREKDPGYARRAEVQEMCRAALAISERRRGEVETLWNDYERGFEDAADRAAAPLRQSAESLAAKGKPAEALAALDAFPAAFKSSQAAMALETFRRDLERRRAAGERPPASYAWYPRFIEAGELVVSNRYSAAKLVYLEAVKGLPEEPPSEPLTRNVYRTGLYNFACIYSVESAALKDDARKQAVDQAFRYLDWALRSGYGERGCKCHPQGGGWAHLAADADLNPVRDDPRYAEVLRKYRK
jgi:hypothetical protein